MEFLRYYRLVLSAVFISLAVGLGYILSTIPNVELITFTIFTSGIILGIGWGSIIGAISFLIFSSINPYGIAPLPILFAQVLSGFIIGFAGGILKLFIYKFQNKKGIYVTFATISGVLVTLIYDILTNIGGYIVIGSSISLKVYIIGGLAFSLIHFISNGIIFGLLSFLWLSLDKIIHPS